ncbi:uncharacterized protein BT62DRAFT_985409 [Guyanagaster necrorhizus]|uniref:GAR domain-containing protein n=1 Tax=Guyanagaster necrorhizus TaxID=856835 RepID=A0A9P8AUZ8_9AGAR|nr:uncharacterized protein BT62DRAFT_985409 [Guyanagaster necrorhizus MCA 3950]KAG7448998.1 hypothetical protein BT62DRAFT_985409 [Guyanagaster necrorhizus MCA 3950]
MEAPVIISGESSGTVVAREEQAAVDVNTDSNESDATQPKSTTDGEEQALESHEVIELQTFIERKAWIEEKIKFLERLPPIEVFVGIEALQISAEDIPGLPSRSKLQKWLQDHESIEKEIEIFDTGELKKLRKLTRAATQRNLSPEDTDLIELTLTTIYELDILLHLLRDRSENLDLLGVRMSWEENRVAAWVERRQIIADLNTFLEDRARWSASFYDAPVSTADPTTPRRRGSTASLASIASENALFPAGFSRPVRFTQVEALSRDSAHFAGRVTALRHGNISTAGKILDKMIDHSRKPVPDQLLDEQDKLEEMGITQMEDIGKFVMNVVMQWRKADDTHVETMKDQVSAQTLLDDIEAARSTHPTGRQSASFVTRAEALRKRLLVRGDPMSQPSTLPTPVHALFPEQQSFNKTLVQQLSNEITSATTMCKKAEAAAADYRSTYEAVHAYEDITQTADSLSAKLWDITQRLETGVTSNNGDGSPPNLLLDGCLEPTKHGVFLALMPSIFQELQSVGTAASQLVRNVPEALLRLNFPAVDSDFQSKGITAVEELKDRLANVEEVRTELVARTERLREARRIRNLMDIHSRDLRAFLKEISMSMQKHRWRQDAERSNAPLTPESPPNIPLPADSSDLDFHQQLVRFDSKFVKDIDSPLEVFCQTLEQPLAESLRRTASELKVLLNRGGEFTCLLSLIKEQATSMIGVKAEVNAFQLRIEDIRIQYESATQECLSGQANAGLSLHNHICLETSLDDIRSGVNAFSDKLPQRIPWVETGAKQSVTCPSPAPFPFALRSLDNAVRHDCNTFTMRLNGDLRSLEQKADHLHLAKLAKEVDLCVSATIDDINDGIQKLSGLRCSFPAAPTEKTVSENLQALYISTDDILQVHSTRIRRSFSPIRELLRSMSTARGVNDAAVHESLFLSRTRAVDDAELKFTTWDSNLLSFRNILSDAQRAAEERRLEDERRLQAEQERLAAEVAEKVRIEREKEEEGRRLKEVQEMERLREAENVRLSAIAEEKARLEAERQEIAKQEIALAEEARRRVELEERARLERERSIMEVKLKKAEEQLAAERQSYADHVAAESRKKLELESRAAEAKKLASSAAPEPLEDVFGLKLSPSDARPQKSQAMIDLQVQILNLRKRLRSISIGSVARATSSSSVLPTSELVEGMNRDFSLICKDVEQLPFSVDDASVQLELDSLKQEVDASSILMDRIRHLVSLSNSLCLCDNALSDLLEHIDSYPAIPLGLLSSPHISPVNQPPEKQLSERLTFTKSNIDNMDSIFQLVSEDTRAIAERERVLQTWSELRDMAQDRITGPKSRPSSVISSGQNSSGRNSRVSIVGTKKLTKKSTTYSNLSIPSSSRGGLTTLSPSTPSRRAISSATQTPSRSVSRISSVVSNRSTSGPLSLYGSTFASRQRTTSLSSKAETPTRGTPSRARIYTPSLKRSATPGHSDMSVSNVGSRPSSSWSRAPRISFPRGSTSQRRPPAPSAPRKTYIANPKSKLDVAVGDVVNNLPVGINIEGISWKDQSGKYWIGDNDPKLCFCRILRSQTVMVRVGGGWAELSKFIRSHFADSFRLLTESPPPMGHREEKWISSATLLETPELAEIENEPVLSRPHLPRTPEPHNSFLPSFALSTPSGKSPHSIKSTPSSKGSPLTPLQFIRRADPETSYLRPTTPSQPPASRLRTKAYTPARNTIWRP